MTTIFEPCEEEAMAILTYNVGATVKKSQKVIIDDWNGFSLTGKEIAELENFPDGKEEQAEHKRASKRIAYRIAKDFKAWSGKNSKMKHRYLGVVLSFAEGDRAKLEADPQLRQQIIQDWLGDMGYDDAQFLAVYHDEANKPHIHIILNLVDMNHKAFDRYRDRYRSQKACRDIEKEYELKVGLGVDESYEVDLKKTGEKNQERVQIGNLAKEAAKTATSFKEFKELLETKGVLVELKTNNNGTQGLVYRYGDKGIPFAGGEVHSSLTYGKVNKQLKKAAATKKAALEALKEKYPFKDAMHMQYIVHGRHDASIFRSVDDGMDCKYKYEAARKALLSRIMFVAGDQRPEAFYDALYSEQKDGNYRVGSLYIEPNGKISFGEELVFGDPEKTAYSMTKAVTIPAPTATLESVSPPAQASTPAVKKANIPSFSQAELREISKYGDLSRFLNGTNYTVTGIQMAPWGGNSSILYLDVDGELRMAQNDNGDIYLAVQPGITNNYKTAIFDFAWIDENGKRYNRDYEAELKKSIQHNDAKQKAPSAVKNKGKGGPSL